MQIAVIVLVGVVLTAAVAGVLVWRRRQRTAAVLAASVATRRRHVELTPRVDALRVETEQLLGRVVGSIADDLSTMMVELTEARDAAAEAVTVLPVATGTAFSVSDAERDERSADKALTVLSHRTSKGEQQAEGLIDRLAAVERGASELDRILAAAARAGDEGRAAGWNVAPIVDELVEVTADAERLSIEPPIDLGRVEPELAALTERSSALLAEIEGLADQHRELVTLSVEQWKRSTELRGEGEWLVNQLEAWELLHHRTSLATVSEHPPAVTGRLDEADELLAEAGGDDGMLAMGRQDIRGAADHLARSDILLDQVDELITEARHLNVELATAAVEAETLVPKAAAAADELTAYVDEHAHDLKATFAEPAASLRQVVSDATAKLALRPPDALNAMRLANRVVEESAERSTEARAEVKRMDRLRSSARSAFSRAESAVKELDRYTDGVLASMFGSQRRDNVERLYRRLHAARRLNEPSVNDPVKAKQQANRIGQEAKDLLEQYKDDDAEDYDD